MRSTVGINGTTYFSFMHGFLKPLVVPPLKTVNTGDFYNVLLDLGTAATLDIIPLAYLDLLSLDVYLR